MPRWLPQGRDQVNKVDWEGLVGSDRRRWLFEPPRDARLGAFERGHRGGLTDGGATGYWSPEHRRR
jgi:hypothetical protein